MTVPLPTEFRRMTVRVAGARINTLAGGDGSPVLLLHGYPQTHVMWHHVAPRLAEHHTLILTDLRGYGDSGKPPGGANHEAYAKAAMARDQVEVIRELGFSEFAVAGHDRGGRVGHRMALDYPEAVTKLAVLDIVPTRHAFQTADMTFGLGYWHWFFLAQPESLPEHLLGADPDGWVRGRLSGGWQFDPDALDEYVRCSATRPRSTPPARTTGPQRASTWPTTTRPPRAATGSPPRCSPVANAVPGSTAPRSAPAPHHPSLACITGNQISWSNEP